MKTKLLFISFLLIFCSTSSFAQDSVKDSLRAFTFRVVKEAIKRGNIKSLSVWDFTDIHKVNSTAGSYISEQFSIYAEKIETIHHMDRQNLKSLLKEHKLKSEGFIDRNTIMQLGKFKEVDAVAVGSVILAGNEFQVNVKIIATTTGEMVGSDEQFFPINERIKAIFNSPSPPIENKNPSEKPKIGSYKDNIKVQKDEILQTSLSSFELNNNNIHAVLKFENINDKRWLGIAFNAEGAGGLADYWKFNPHAKGRISDNNGNEYSISEASGLGFAKQTSDWTLIKPHESSYANLFFNRKGTQFMGKTFSLSLEIQFTWRDLENNQQNKVVTVYFQNIEL
jgi:hypothetical protein